MRQKAGGVNASFFILQQLPVIRPETYDEPTRWDDRGPLHDWLAARVFELIYVSHDMQPLARDHGYEGPPLRWDADRRFLLRCELDAAFFHLYGLARHDVDYVMDTFPVFGDRDVTAHGEYRTKRVILEIYDELADAVERGTRYETRLVPPPVDPRTAHPPRAEAVELST